MVLRYIILLAGHTSVGGGSGQMPLKSLLDRIFNLYLQVFAGKH